jgi:hypothetical protein
VHGQLLGKHRLSGSGRPVEQQVPVHPTVQSGKREKERKMMLCTDVLFNFFWPKFCSVWPVYKISYDTGIV